MTPENTTYITAEIINQSATTPSESPSTIGKIEYDNTKDTTMFINVSEGTTRPITTVKNKISSNLVIDYDNFVKDDGY